MPEILVLSDIHGNLEALTAVLELEVNRLRLPGTELVVLGDSVDYGAGSLEVRQILDRYRAWLGPRYVEIRGNHDDAVINKDCSRFRSAHGRLNFEKTLKDLEGYEFPDLPLTEVRGNIMYTHGTLEDPLWGSYGNVTPVSSIFVEDKDKIIIVGGHSHVSGVKELDAETLYVNPGSVGQPRNGNVRAQYAIISSDEVLGTRTVGMCSVPYNIDLAARKVEESGRPPFLATRLFLGA